LTCEHIKIKKKIPSILVDGNITIRKNSNGFMRNRYRQRFCPLMVLSISVQNQVAGLLLSFHPDFAKICW